jgi:hypothetical protein
MGAPNTVRGQSMSGNLSALDAARAGLLSVIAADYRPAAFAPGIFKLVDIVEGGPSAAVAMATGNAGRSRRSPESWRDRHRPARRSGGGRAGRRPSHPLQALAA